MNFWAFLDRNSHGLFLLALVVLAVAFGDDHGCRLKAGCASVETGQSLDGGTP